MLALEMAAVIYHSINFWIGLQLMQNVYDAALTKKMLNIFLCNVHFSYMNEFNFSEPRVYSIFYPLNNQTLLFGKSSYSYEQNLQIFIAVQHYIKKTKRFE